MASSAKAVYRAMRSRICEEIWLQKVLSDLSQDNDNICIPYIPSSQQVADIVIKGLLKLSFDSCVNKLGFIDI